MHFWLFCLASAFFDFPCFPPQFFYGFLKQSNRESLFKTIKKLDALFCLFPLAFFSALKIGHQFLIDFLKRYAEQNKMQTKKITMWSQMHLIQPSFGRVQSFWIFPGTGKRRTSPPTKKTVCLVSGHPFQLVE